MRPAYSGGNRGGRKKSGALSRTAFLTFIQPDQRQREMGVRMKFTPLRENLAAGILFLTGWQPGTRLLDPMCGGGTLLVEAAMMALRMPPGGARSFAFQKLHGFDSALWESVLSAARSTGRKIGFRLPGSIPNAPW